ncbi:hypothetical protein [Pseudarthrobacter sp. NIBRBAC000502770]|uniref:hypothetical protein n=1 Tax=Pseudarthrobacter sp. NIBRBAC000502770 TaxID=2590785 RepID=UPI00113FDC5F|nr:hypothetical protein [Pseudarthrobacter sp. NIBRBAC000502770]QDG87100.1 hypothetical protein NIBR502770_00300 [Pseudarthrobacter sp. NIBRBAC000502770]
MKLHRNPDSETAAQAGGMIAALSHIDSAGFHGIDMALGGASPTIDPSWAGHVRKARIAAASVSWPDDLQPQLTAFTDAAGRLAAALDEGDTKAASVPAREVHAAWHTLSNRAWNYLAKTSGIEKEGGPAGHQHHRAP